MKCARCAHQWKLAPEDAMPDEDVLFDDETADNAASDQEDHQWQDHSGAVGAGYDDSEPDQAEDAWVYEENAGSPVAEEQWAPLQADDYSQMHHHAGAAYNDPAAEAAEPPLSEEEIAASQGRGDERQHGQPSAGPHAGRGQAYPIPSAVYEASSEIYENETAPLEDVAPSDQQETEETSALEQGENWSSRFMGPGWRAQKASPPVEEEEDEDPESVIRETFRSVLQRTEEEEEQTAAPGSAEHTEASNSYGSIYDADWNRSGDEGDEIANARGLQSAFHQQQVDYEDDPGAEAFATSAQDETGIGEISEEDYYTAQAVSDEAASGFTRGGYDANEDFMDRETIGNFAPQDGRPQPYDMDEGDIEGYGNEPRGFAAPEEPQDYTAPYGNQFDDAAERHAGEDGFGEPLTGFHDDDRLDTVDEAYLAEHQSRSGLAVAAGWVAFLSLMGGLLLGIVNFRQDVMAALPGTVNMYRMLGYEIGLNKVDLASVDYKWSEIDGRPAIELRGEVINITDKSVKVPPVLVNVRSTSGAVLKAEATVPTDELGPRDSATFTLELVSPPEDVSHIELEFAPSG